MVTLKHQLHIQDSTVEVEWKKEHEVQAFSEIDPTDTDQNGVEDLAVAAGIEIPDRVILHTNDLLEQRDAHRWELSVESSEDYYDRQDSLD